MPRRFPGSTIAVSLSTHGTLLPGWMVQHIAASAGIGGIDIDATTAFGAWLATRSGTTQPAYVPVRSVWVPLSGIVSGRARRLLESIASRQQDDQPLVVAALPAASAYRGLARELEAVCRAAPDPARLAIGLSSASLRGGRPHLVQLGGLRHLAEEWDVSIAVDLAGRFDPTWEAEAAIARIGNRLSVLRVRAAAPSRSAVGQDRVACRALHAAVDRGRFVEIAISSARGFPWPTTPRASGQNAHRAVDYIAERAALHAEALREGIDHFEGSPSSRGG